MKKIYTLVVVAILGTTTIFAQGIGAALDYAIWNGAMIENSDATGSTILSLNYTHNLSEKIDLVGSVGYGMGFGIIPMKADLNYGITNKLSANLGMGIYMISDSTYDANATGVYEDGSTDAIEGSTNEFGMNVGLSYQLTSALSLGFNYNMIKSGDYDFNGIQFGLAYSFGGGEPKDKTAPKKKKVVAPKKVVVPNSTANPQ
jgi:opacity protein-like surface antigen